MLYFEKSSPSPECLQEEKNKASGSYSCGDVLDRLRVDFHNKCYICEDSQPHSINVEHLIPHRGDSELKFAWDNLFWSCSHCNNTKLDKYDDILNCTEEELDIESKLSYEFKPYPFESVTVVPLSNDQNCINTAALIEAVFNGSTKLKKIESANLRNKLLDEMQEFQQYLIEYFRPTADESEKEQYKSKIRAHLHRASSFTSFKRCVIKENSRLSAEFSCFIE